MHLDGLLDAHEALRGVLLENARAADEVDERGARAVHDRNFRRVHVDVKVVDSKAVEGAHEMLDRRDHHLALVERRGKTRVVDRFGANRKFDSGREINATEDDAGVGRSRVHHEFDLAAGMQTNAAGRDGLLESALLDQVETFLAALTSADGVRAMPVDGFQNAGDGRTRSTKSKNREPRPRRRRPENVLTTEHLPQAAVFLWKHLHRWP